MDDLVDGHIRVSLGNIAVITVIAVLGVGATLIVLNYFKDKSVPVVSHLSIGGYQFLNGKVAA